jgi:hypothetical protein
MLSIRRRGEPLPDREISPRVTTRYRAVLGSEASPPVTIVVLDRKVTVSTRPRGRRTLVTARVQARGWTGASGPGGAASRCLSENGG